MFRPVALSLMLLAASCTSAGENTSSDSSASSTTLVASNDGDSAEAASTTSTLAQPASSVDPGNMTAADLSAAWDDVLAAEEFTVTYSSLQAWPDGENRETRSIWTNRGDRSHFTTSTVAVYPSFDTAAEEVPTEMVTSESEATRFSADERLLVQRGDFLNAPFGVTDSAAFVDLGGANPLAENIGFGAMLELPYTRSLNIKSAEYLESVDDVHRYRIEINTLEPRVFVVDEIGQIVGVESPAADPSSDVIDEVELVIERTIDESLLEPLENPVIVSLTDVLDGVDDSGDVPVSAALVEASINALADAPELTIDLELAGPVDQTASFSWIVDRDGTSSVRTNLSGIAADAFSSAAFEDVFASPPSDDEESDRGMGAVFAVEYLGNIAAPIECRYDAAGAVVSSEALNDAAQLTVAWYDLSGIADGWDFDFVQPFRTRNIDKPWTASQVGGYACRTFDDESRGLLPDVRDELDVVWLSSNDGVHRVAVFESLENPGPYLYELYRQAWVLTIDESGQILASQKARLPGPIGALIEDDWSSALTISYGNVETIAMPPSSDIETFGE